MPSVTNGNAITSTAQIGDGVIVDADINASAAIAKTKLAALHIVDADIDAHTTSKITVPSSLLSVASEAQGDILIRGASGWVRLAAGNSGQFLKTLGAAANPAWAAAGATSYLFRQSTDGVTAGTATKVTFSTAGIDALNEWDAVNTRFTVSAAGTYAVHAQMMLMWGTTATTGEIWIYKNGAAVAHSAGQMPSNVGGVGGVTVNVKWMGTLAANDYIEIFAARPNGNGSMGDATAANHNLLITKIA